MSSRCKHLTRRNSVYESCDLVRVQLFTGVERMGDYISLLRYKICRVVQSPEV